MAFDDMQGEKVRILIVEDHPIFRMGMIDLINQENDMMVCGYADNVSDGRKALERLQPDMVIVDLSLRNSNGIELVKEINLHHRGLPMLVLSMHDELMHAERCLIAGARGYVMKQETSQSVVDAIRHIMAGNTYISRTIMENIVNRFKNRPESLHKSPLYSLTDRELEVLQLIGNGFSSGRIAEHLNLSVKTVGTYRERIKEKLRLKDGADLVRYAVLMMERDPSVTPNPPD